MGAGKTARIVGIGSSWWELPGFVDRLAQRGLVLAQADDQLVPDLILADVDGSGAELFGSYLETLTTRELHRTRILVACDPGAEGIEIPAILGSEVEFLDKPLSAESVLERISLAVASVADERRADADEWAGVGIPGPEAGARAGVPAAPPAGPMAADLPVDYLAFRTWLVDAECPEAERKEKLERALFGQVYPAAESAGIHSGRLARLMARFVGAPFLDRVRPEMVRLDALPRAFARSNSVLLVDTDDGEAALVVSNPFDGNLPDALRRTALPLEVLPVWIADPTAIRLVLEADVSATRATVHPPVIVKPVPAHAAGAAGRAALVAPLTPVAESGTDIREQPVAFIASTLLDMAVEERASDLHLEPKRDDYVVRFRVDGDLRDVMTLKSETGIRVISRFKVLAGMDIAERRKPQDGSFSTTVGDRAWSVRLATTSTPTGQSLTARLLEPYAKPREPEDLGLGGAQATLLGRMMNHTAGLLLVVGPTGSGKTTTIYNLLARIDGKKRSIVSVEDPVEYRIPWVNQQQVNERAGATFESLLRSMVRQDPDILFLGEIRDSASAKIAVDFASTGHLTITTLHTTNATSAIFRLERLGVDRGALADAMLAVVAQRLVRRLCPHCKRIEAPTPEERDLLARFTANVPETVGHSPGCEYCRGLGCLGREGVYEILHLDPDLARMIRVGAPIEEIRAFAGGRGGFLIGDHAMDKIREHACGVRQIYTSILVEEEGANPIDLSRRTAVPGTGPGATDDPHAPVAGDATEDTAAEPDPDVPDAAAWAVSETDFAPATLVPLAVVPRAIPEMDPGPAVLVVEDDAVTRKVIGRYLSDGGMVVTTAGDGIEALIQIGHQQFDLILSDIQMPNLDGLRLQELLKVKGIDTPVILVTGSESEEDELAALNMGAADYIRKPIRREVLVARVKRALGRRLAA